MPRKDEKKYRQQLLNKGECASHPGVKAVSKTLCQNCLDNQKRRRQQALANGKCPNHPQADAAPGRYACLECLDYQAIVRLPRKARATAQKRADETREARLDGTYRCPAWGFTEREYREMFPNAVRQGVWEFDHKGDDFRDIILRRVNFAIGNLTSTQLRLATEYVSRFEAS